MYTYKHLCVYTYACIYYIIIMWENKDLGVIKCVCRSEDSLYDSALSFSHVSSRTKHRSLGLVISSFTHGVISVSSENYIYLFSHLCLCKSYVDLLDKVYFPPWKRNLSADHEDVGKNAGVHHGCVFWTLVKHSGMVKIKKLLKLFLAKESLTASH